MTIAESPQSTASWSGPEVRLARHPERGSHDRAEVSAIIDEALIAHVALETDSGVMCLPMAHARVDDRIYLHGAVANRMLRSLCERGRASLTFTLVDGLVLARTAFHHSMNYRSAVVIGPAAEVQDPVEKRLALAALIEHLAEGRMGELSEPSQRELDATRVVRVTIEQASCKVRTGPPRDGTSELTQPVWAGTIPLGIRAEAPQPDPLLPAAQRMSSAAARRALGMNATARSVRRGEYLFSTDPARLQTEWVHAFLRDRSYWARGLDEKQFRTALHRSIVFGVYRGATQVAFARVVSDDARFAYLCDVFVTEELRGQGLGKQLIEFVLEHPSVRAATRCILGTADAHGLYEPFGFERAPDGRYMVRAPGARPNRSADART